MGGASPVGALGFNTTRAERDWPDALVKRLQLVAQVFANALARKRADEALRESEERLALAADSAEAGLWVLDYAHRRLLGHRQDPGHLRVLAGRGHHAWSVSRRRSTPTTGTSFGESSSGSAHAGEPVSVEYRIVPGDGRTRWIVSRGRAQFTSTGEPDRLMGVTVDITERKRARGGASAPARLAWRREPSSPASRSTRWTSAQAPSYSTTGFATSAASPRTRRRASRLWSSGWSTFIPTTARAFWSCAERLHDGRLDRLSLEYRYLHPDRGRSGSSTRRASPRATRPDARSAPYGVLRDITERKRAEDELHDLSQRLIGAHEDERALLARELHDDVSQRLAVLAIDVGRAELAAPDGAQAEAMQEIRAGLVRLSEDIHSLAYQLHPSILEELGLAEALRAECERRERQGRLDLSADLDPLPAVIGKDAALCLFRVAQEALNNVARHAGVRAASVTLRQMDGGLLLAVSDGGVGFDPEHPGEGDAPRPREHARTRAAGERHARHRERARPRHDDPRVGAGGGRVVMSLSRPPRVLLADDHLLVAEALKSLLTPEFDLVGVVEDGRALVEAAGRLRPDVIVADITMPHLNGIDALIQLRQAGDHVPVVFLTMHRDATFARRALEAGASGFVLKHSASVELITALHAALEGRTYLTPQLAEEVMASMKQGPERAADPISALTPRQREVLQLLAEGRPAKQIAASLSISARTVEFHKYQMMEALDIHTNADLIHFAIKHGLVEF